MLQKLYQNISDLTLLNTGLEVKAVSDTEFVGLMRGFIFL